MTAMLRNLAQATTRRPRVSIAALLLLSIALIGAGTSAGGDFVDDFTVPGIESQKAQDLIGERFPGQGGDSATVVLTSGGPLKQAGRASAIAAATAAIERQPHVSSVEDPFSAGHLSRDGRTAFTTVTYDGDADDLGKEPRERLEEATKPLARAGVGVAMAGPIVDAGNEGALPIGELAGVVVALVLLLLVLRSARAALSSLLTAFVGLGLGFAALGLAAAGMDIPSLAPTMAAMLGLGAGIDYALLSASRVQEELRAGRTPAAAATRANETAGHSAVTAAGIVLVSISGLLVTGIPFVGKVGVAAGVMVLLTALVGVLLLPPLFAAAGRKMLPRRERAQPAAPADPFEANGFDAAAGAGAPPRRPTRATPRTPRTPRTPGMPAGPSAGRGSRSCSARSSRSSCACRRRGSSWVSPTTATSRGTRRSARRTTGSRPRSARASTARSSSPSMRRRTLRASPESCAPRSPIRPTSSPSASRPSTEKGTRRS